MTSYRLNRALAVSALGVNFVVAAAASFVAFQLLQFDGAAALIGWVAMLIAVLAVCNGVRVLGWPPVVARLDSSGIRAGHRRTGTVRVRWKDIENVAVVGAGAARRVQFVRAGGGVDGFALVLVEPRGDDFLRDVHDRLDAANGYRRFGP